MFSISEIVESFFWSCASWQSLSQPQRVHLAPFAKMFAYQQTGKGYTVQTDAGCRDIKEP